MALSDGAGGGLVGRTATAHRGGGHRGVEPGGNAALRRSRPPIAAAGSRIAGERTAGAAFVSPAATSSPGTLASRRSASRGGGAGRRRLLVPRPPCRRRSARWSSRTAAGDPRATRTRGHRGLAPPSRTAPGARSVAAPALADRPRSASHSTGVRARRARGQRAGRRSRADSTLAVSAVGGVAELAAAAEVARGPPAGAGRALRGAPPPSSPARRRAALAPGAPPGWPIAGAPDRRRCARSSHPGLAQRHSPDTPA